MMARRGLPPAVLVGAPLVMLLVGGGVGWFMRDSGGATASDGTVVGRAMPSGSELDAQAPLRSLPGAPNTMLIDHREVIGYPEVEATLVPRGGALPLALDAGGSATVVDALTLRPIDDTPPAALPPVEPVPLPAAVPPAAPPSTAAPVESTSTTALEPNDGFVDPCTTTVDAPCAGVAGRTTAEPTPGDRVLDPLTMSVPFAATGAFASMCGTIEGSAVPDPFLTPAVRPTIAVVVNQPSSVALTGTWSDGTPLEKLTMVTSPEFDQQWQQQWDTEGRQGLLLACSTLPLETVRAHASAGRADLSAGLLAISATGRTELDGDVIVSMPLDGEDPPFVDQVAIGSLGEQFVDDGSLAPTVHVHYAVTTDTLIPAVSTLDQRTAKVYARHEFVENADCAGWANNQQGLARTSTGSFSVAFEQRTVNGRSRPVTVVDGDLRLDPVLPGGWEGFVCTHLFVADDAGNRVTVALRGAQVRSPLTATYGIGVVLDDPALPAGWTLEATWVDAQGSLWCGPATLTVAAPGASCTTYARSSPDGITLLLRAIDESGARRPAFVATLPVNTAYCTPDDPYAFISDGCATGATARIRVPADTTGEQSVRVAVQVTRTALAGSVQTSPAHAWRIDVTQSFVF
jgi:hypothetical protein